MSRKSLEDQIKAINFGKKKRSKGKLVAVIFCWSLSALLAALAIAIAMNPIVILLSAWGLPGIIVAPISLCYALFFATIAAMLLGK